MVIIIMHCVRASISLSVLYINKQSTVYAKTLSTGPGGSLLSCYTYFDPRGNDHYFHTECPPVRTYIGLSVRPSVPKLQNQATITAGRDCGSGRVDHWWLPFLYFFTYLWLWKKNILPIFYSNNFKLVFLLLRYWKTCLCFTFFSFSVSGENIRQEWKVIYEKRFWTMLQILCVLIDIAIWRLYDKLRKSSTIQ